MTSKLKEKLFHRKDRSRDSGEFQRESPGTNQHRVETTTTTTTTTKAGPTSRKPPTDALQDLSLNDTNNNKSEWPLTPAQTRQNGQPTAGSASTQQNVSKGVVVGSANDPYNEAIANKNISREESLLSGDLSDSHAVRVALERHDRDGTLAGRPSGENARPQGPRPMSDKPLPEAPQEASLRQRYSEDASRDNTTDEGTSHARITSVPAFPDEQSQSRQVNGGETVPSLPPIAHPSPLDIDRGIEPSSRSQAKNVDLMTAGSASRRQMVQASDQPLDLSKVVDLTNTEDTTRHVTQAPVVTNETVHVNTHEIITEAVTREIHTHDVYHRILPIKDVEVLPPRHFVPRAGSAGGYTEIRAAHAPGGIEASQKLRTVLQEAAKAQLMPEPSAATGRRQFSARTFEDGEGDFRSSTDGSRTQQTWVHHPVLEDGGQRTGQTVPFHFGEASEGAVPRAVESRRRRSTKGADAKRAGIVVPKV